MVRTDAQLAALVLRFAQLYPQPYRMLIHQLLGLETGTEQLARDQWNEFVAHRQALSGALGRTVQLRVAAMDLLSAASVDPRRRPRLVSADVLGRLVSAATRDPLTGLANRAQAIAVVDHELRRRRRLGLAVTYLDLDGFKGVNDVYGHARGDAVLVDFARLLRSAGRTEDLAARLGGDEFALIQPGATAKDARRIADGVKAACVKQLGRLGIGVSAGIAVAKESDTADSLFARADEAMYRRKRQNPVRRPRTEPLPLLLLGTTDPGRLLSLSEATGPDGFALLACRRPEHFVKLAALVAPAAVLADVLYPPKGGQSALDQIQGVERKLLVAPARFWSMHAGRPAPVPVLRVPIDAQGLKLLGAIPGGDRARAVAPLRSSAEAKLLLDAVEAVVGGDGKPPPAVASRPELITLLRQLGLG